MSHFSASSALPALGAGVDHCAIAPQIGPDAHLQHLLVPMLRLLQVGGLGTSVDQVPRRSPRWAGCHDPTSPTKLCLLKQPTNNNNDNYRHIYIYVYRTNKITTMITLLGPNGRKTTHVTAPEALEHGFWKGLTPWPSRPLKAQSFIHFSALSRSPALAQASIKLAKVVTSVFEMRARTRDPWPKSCL